MTQKERQNKIIIVFKAIAMIQENLSARVECTN